MGKLSKNISFSVTKHDKLALKKKAENLGLSLAAMIRNIVLDKYKTLQLGYMQSATVHDINIRRLKPPPAPEAMTKEHVSMKECITDLKSVFANLSKASNKGMNILENMENEGMMIKAEIKTKSDEELEILKAETQKKMQL